MRDKDYIVEVDGKLVTLAELKTAYRFWREYHWDKHTTDCPMCGTDLNSAGLFVCEVCGELLPIEEESPYATGVCRECDELYQDEKAYEEAVNAKIDEMRGK